MSTDPFSKEAYLDLLETLNAEVLNGGFAQYFMNQVEHDKELRHTLLPLVVHTLNTQWSTHPPMMGMSTAISAFPATMQELDRRRGDDEDDLYELMDSLDTTYYAVFEDAVSHFEALAAQLNALGNPYDVVNTTALILLPPTSKPRCKLTGTNGNIFALAGRAREVLIKVGRRRQSEQMNVRLLQAGSYQEAIRVIEDYVDAY